MKYVFIIHLKNSNFEYFWLSVQVEFFSNEKSLKERLRLYFIKNKRSSKIIYKFILLIN